MQREDYFTIDIDKDGIATLWLDQQNEKVNKVGPDEIDLFEGVIDEMQKDSKVKAVIMISRKKDFIAGADIEAFQQVQKPGDWAPISRRGHVILNKIANSKKPVVAAIHGNCLGAGLEIALACTARIAANDKSTKLALPEVQLGLLPGGGGTQRLPRLVGLQKSLDMMLTGKNIFAKPAKKMGLVDRLVFKDGLHKGAVVMVKEMLKKPLVRKRKTSLKDKVLEGPLKGVVFKKAKEMVDRQTQGNYPAPYKILECVEIGLRQGMQRGLEAEAEKFEELILTQVSRQLINIFFAMTEKKKNPMKELARRTDKFAMLGAGFMGAGITEVSIKQGIDVVLKDIKQETLSSAKQTIWQNYAKRIKRKAMSKVEADRLMTRVDSQLDYQGFDQVDMVIEAVFEDINLKQRVIGEVEAVIKDDCIFASNTSALPISSMSKVSKRPELVIGMHYFSPVPKMPLLEIVVTDQTADWVTATCLELGIRQGKTCIVVKDGPGFYTTRILAPFFNEALLMLTEGAKMEDIDKQVKIFGFPVGPVTLLDEVGIDVGAHVMSGDLIEYYKLREGAVTAGEPIKKMFEAGYSGRKNKKGFYLYDDKGKKVRGKVNESAYDFFGGPNRKDFDKQEIQQRCGLVMLNEAALCLQEEIIASPLDGDVGAIFGLGFPPFRGGPFRYMDHVGADTILSQLEALSDKHTARFKPADIIYDYAKSGKKFYV